MQLKKQLVTQLQNEFRLYKYAGIETTLLFYKWIFSIAYHQYANTKFIWRLSELKNHW